MDLAQAPRVDHLDAKASLSELRRPRPVLEEDGLELVPGRDRPVEHALQHRLGAAQALSPGNCDDDSHVVSPMRA